MFNPATNRHFFVTLLMLLCALGINAQDVALPTVSKDANETLSAPIASMDEPDMDDMLAFFSLPNINFHLGKSTIPPSQESSVRQVANHLKNNPTAIITIISYGDSTCTNEASSILLANNRAKAVIEMLTKKMDIEPERIKTDPKKEPARPTPVPVNEKEEGKDLIVADMVVAVMFSVSDSSLQ